MDSADPYWCRLCGRNHDNIPDDVIEIGAIKHRGRFHLTRFPDGSIHDIRRNKQPESRPPQLVMGHRASDVRRIAEEIDQVEQKEVLREGLTELLVEPGQKSKPANGIMAAAFSKMNKEQQNGI